MRILKILFLLTSYMIGQSFEIKVISEEDGYPLEGVRVKVLNTNLSFLTDKNGIFLLSENLAGKTFEFYKEDYRSKIYPFNDLKKNKEIKLKKFLYEYDKDVIITGNRFEVNKSESNEAVSVLTVDEINDLNPRSLPEALMTVPGVWMQKTNHGSGSPFIRGLTGNQSLILVDGVRLNNSTYRYGPNQYLVTVDRYLAERIEVLRGNGSVLYGSDALGGVINIISKEPIFSNENVFNGSVLGKYFNYDMEMTGHIDYSYSSPNVAIAGGLSVSDFGDIVAGGDLGTEIASSYNEYAGNIKIKFRANDNLYFTTIYQNLLQEKVGRYDQVAQRGYEYYNFDPQQRQLALLKLTYLGKNKWFNKLDFSVNYQISREERKKKKLDSTTSDYERDDIKTYGTNLEIFSNPFNNYEFISGAEFYYDYIESETIKNNLIDGSSVKSRGLYPDGSTALNAALFSNHKIKYDNFIFGAGIRFNYFSLKIEELDFPNVELTPTAFVFNSSIQYKLNYENNISFSINSGFRAPNINDMSSFGSFDFGIEVPTDELDPEKSLTFELGYNYFSEMLTGSLFFYRTNLTNLIDREKSTYNGSEYYNDERVYKKVNVGEAYIQGVELELLYSKNNFETGGYLIYTYGQNLTKDEPVRRIPPFNGSLYFSYKIFDDIKFKTEFLFATKQDRLAGGDLDDHRIPDGGTPGWTNINIYGNYKFNEFNFNIGLVNLFNEAYRYHGSGVDSFGRSLWGSIRYNFHL